MKNQTIIIATDSNFNDNFGLLAEWKKPSNTKHHGLDHGNKMKNNLYQLLLHLNFLVIKNITNSYFDNIIKLLTPSNMDNLYKLKHPALCTQLIFKENQLIPIDTLEIANPELILNSITSLKLAIIANRYSIVFEY